MMQRSLIGLFILAFWATAPLAAAQQSPCPNVGPLFVIREHDSQAANARDDQKLEFVRYAVRGLRTENALVLLGPNVDLDFSVLPPDEFSHPRRLIEVARCVRILGVADLSLIPAGAVAQPITPETQSPAATSTYRVNPSVLAGAMRELSGNVGGATAGVSRDPGATGPVATWDASWVNLLVEARAPGRFGPIIRYGRSRSGEITTFLSVRCWEHDRSLSRMAGFRIAGPTTGQQNTVERGISIERCPGVEIANMEIYGWGAFAIGVSDNIQGAPPLPPATDRAHPIRIHGNYIHHNQHPGGNGYGVNVGGGAWAHIYENVFDFNRHAIATGWDVGGYRAERNLVLKGGGYHSALHHTHQFDVHGSGCIWSGDLCGTAGDEFWMHHNTFQYTNGISIEIRGLPRTGAEISGNIFAVERLMNVYNTIGVYDAMINPAIALNRDDNVTSPTTPPTSIPTANTASAISTQTASMISFRRRALLGGSLVSASFPGLTSIYVLSASISSSLASSTLRGAAMCLLSRAGSGCCSAAATEPRARSVVLARACGKWLSAALACRPKRVANAQRCRRSGVTRKAIGWRPCLINPPAGGGCNDLTWRSINSVSTTSPETGSQT